MVPLAIGAHAALNKRSLDAAKATEAHRSPTPPSFTARAGIGNGRYPTPTRR